jgi:hypothetical protein
MAEAQPSRRRGGHAYGRRHSQMSNTAEEGELCLYVGHAIGRFSEKSMRYDSHQACTRCVASAREGRLSFDINRLLKRHRSKALDFWSNVDIASPDECWNWHGKINSRTKQPQFSWRRAGIASSTQHHPQRVAMWLTWGDLGFTGVKTTCGNKYCCNPFHLIPQKIGVFVDHDSYHDSFELACELHTLKQQINDYQMDKAIEKEVEVKRVAEVQARHDMLMDVDTGYNDRFQAVLTDMLQGRHISQTEAEDRDMYKQIPTDHSYEEIDDSDEDEPTDF